MTKTILIFSLFAILLTLGVSCQKDNNAAAIVGSSAAALPAAVISPAGNLQELQKIALGKLLFFDPILSGNKDVACASCHQPGLGYTDNLDIAIGVNGVGLGTLRHFSATGQQLFTKRNTPTIVNAAFNGIVDGTVAYDPLAAPMFYDLRKSSLELQSLEPIKALEEMRGTLFTTDNALDSVVARLNNISEYKDVFQKVFLTSGAVNATNLAKAIAAFERTVAANNSPYDRYVRGETGALTSAQINGLAQFKQIGCDKCHSGPMFSDYQTHVLSVPDNAKIASDAGLNGTYAFRTPTLRNLNLTEPYMHNGAFQTLDDVMTFYDDVGKGRSQNRNVSNNQLDAKLQGLNDNQRNAIIAFLTSLNDNSFDKIIPSSVPSGLHPGGN